MSRPPLFIHQLLVRVRTIADISEELPASLLEEGTQHRRQAGHDPLNIPRKHRSREGHISAAWGWDPRDSVGDIVNDARLQVHEVKGLPSISGVRDSERTLHAPLDGVGQ